MELEGVVHTGNAPVSAFRPTEEVSCGLYRSLVNSAEADPLIHPSVSLTHCPAVEKETCTTNAQPDYRHTLQRKPLIPKEQYTVSNSVPFNKVNTAHFKLSLPD